MGKRHARSQWGLGMIRFECRVCQSRLWLSEVGTWLAGEPFCNATCSAQIDEAMLRQKTPSVEEHLEALPKLLGDAGIYVRQVSDYVFSIHQHGETMQRDINLGRRVGELAFGSIAVVGAIAASVKLDHDVDRYHQPLWDQFAHLEVVMKDVVRRSMALQQAGYPMAPTLIVAVQNTDRLDPEDSLSANDLLDQIFADLEQAYRVVLSWSAAHK